VKNHPGEVFSNKEFSTSSEEFFSEILPAKNKLLAKNFPVKNYPNGELSGGKLSGEDYS
jgi:hypothetical protein